MRNTSDGFFKWLSAVKLSFAPHSVYKAISEPITKEEIIINIILNHLIKKQLIHLKKRFGLKKVRSRKKVTIINI